jgi:hypothetical protein
MRGGDVDMQGFTMGSPNAADRLRGMQVRISTHSEMSYLESWDSWCRQSDYAVGERDVMNGIECPGNLVTQ